MADGELPHLETFCKAAELLNFTAAAEALNITQAAVSQRIRVLEEDVGVSLFDRHAGRVTLSSHGKILYDYAQRLLALGMEARAALGQARPDLTGELNLAASTIPAEYLLPELLRTFQQRHPKVRVLAMVADSTVALEALEAGRVTLALVGRPGSAAWAESKPFARDHLVLAVPPEHRWARRARIRADELRDEPLVLREPGSGARACLEEALAQRHLSLRDFRVGLELGSNESIKEAVVRGAGVAVLSSFAVRADVQSGRLHLLELADLEVARDLYVVTDRRRILPPAARAFVEVVQDSPFARG